MIRSIMQMPEKPTIVSDKIRISFDYDGTLDQLRVQEVVGILLEKYQNDIEIYIVTRRYQIEGEEVLQTCASLGLDDMNIIYTDRAFKYPTLINNNIDLHIDNDYIELYQIPLREEVNILIIYSEDWINKLFNYIDRLL